jgi:hypothetical protein
VNLTKESFQIQQNPSGNNSTSGNETTTNESSNTSSALVSPSAMSPSAGTDSGTHAKPTPADALPDRDAATAGRIGLVGAWAGALVLGKRD